MLVSFCGEFYFKIMGYQIRRPISLINLMCNSRLFTDGGALEEYGLIIHVRIGLKGESEKLLRKKV